MFEKITKKWSAKATDSAIEGAKETLNDRMDKYSDIIQIGLVVAVIALGGNKLIGHGKKNQQNAGYLPSIDRETVGGSPIVINNYYTGMPLERDIYGKRATKAAKGTNKTYLEGQYGRKAGQNHQKY